jgi:hypothetical protein
MVETMPRSSRWTAVALCALAVACGGVDGDEAAGPTFEATEGAGDAHNEGPLSQAFAAAALEFDLDVELLKAIGYVSSRFDHRGGEPSLEGGYGIMNLVSRETDMVAEAAEVPGLSPAIVLADFRPARRSVPLRRAARGRLALEARPPRFFRDALARWAGEVDPLVVEAFSRRPTMSIPRARADRRRRDDRTPGPRRRLRAVSIRSAVAGRRRRRLDRWVPATPANLRGRGPASRRHDPHTLARRRDPWCQNPRANVPRIRSSDG